jgi:hypothetical protein
MDVALKDLTDRLVSLRSASGENEATLLKAEAEVQRLETIHEVLDITFRRHYK